MKKNLTITRRAECADGLANGFEKLFIFSVVCCVMVAAMLVFYRLLGLFCVFVAFAVAAWLSKAFVCFFRTKAQGSAGRESNRA